MGPRVHVCVVYVPRYFDVVRLDKHYIIRCCIHIFFYSFGLYRLDLRKRSRAYLLVDVRIRKILIIIIIINVYLITHVLSENVIL